MTSRIGLIAAALFLSTIVAANYFVENIGTQFAPGDPHTLPVGFGLRAPSGVLLVGLAFTLRDVVQRTLGTAAVLVCIAAGTGLAALISPALAAASALAFAASELADLAMYTAVIWRAPDSPGRFVAAVAVSNVVGAVVDSVVFLTIAFGSLEFLDGQVVGKLLMTVAALPVVALARRRIPAGT